jgi:hypothetical protein
MQLAVHVPAERNAEAAERLRSMAGALAAFTQSRLATFQIGKISPQNGRRKRLRPFLLSHEELATLWPVHIHRLQLDPTAPDFEERIHVIPGAIAPWRLCHPFMEVSDCFVFIGPKGGGERH